VRWLTSSILVVSLLGGGELPLASVKAEHAAGKAVAKAGGAAAAEVKACAGGAGNTATVANPGNLLSRQGPAEMTGSQIKRLTSKMKANGFDPAHPIEVATVEDRQIIIDGHHRAAAAVRAGMHQVPVTVTPVTPARAAQLAGEAAEAAAQRSLQEK